MIKVAPIQRETIDLTGNRAIGGLPLRAPAGNRRAGLSR
jgi:hypothetical protein